MWYDVLPSMVIITAAMAVPGLLTYVANKLVNGNPYHRSLMDDNLKRQYLRDKRLTGDPYVLAGLENIPDEDPKKPCDEDCECPEGEEFVCEEEDQETEAQS